MLASPFGATLSRMVRRNWEYKAMKSRVLKFVKSEGDNRESYTFLHVVPGQKKKGKRLLVPGTLASLIIVISGLAIFFALELTTTTKAINGFSTNQELPLPALAPIGPAPVAFIVRGLEPSVRVAPDGAVYVSSIRGVPGGVDLHRYYATVDGPPGVGGTYPFKYEGQPDNCGIFASSGCANNQLDPFGLGLGGGDVDIAVNYPSSGVPNLALVSLTLAPGITGTHSTTRGDSFTTPNPVVALIPVDDRQWFDGL